jgi:hypothetical protein
MLWAFGNLRSFGMFFPIMVNCTKRKSGNHGWYI